MLSFLIMYLEDILNGPFFFGSNLVGFKTKVSYNGSFYS